MVYELVEECSGNLEESAMISVALNDYECRSCAIYGILLSVLLTISIGIGTVLIYFFLYSKKSNTDIVKINLSTETVVYWMKFHWTYKWEISSK